MPASREFPLAYLITVRTYGTWLPGDERGWVDRDHNQLDTPTRAPNPHLERHALHELKFSPLILDLTARAVIERVLPEVCAHRRWQLHGSSVRTNHFHAVVGAQRDPEFVMNSFKSWGTRGLVDARLVERGRKVWERHGSTRYLWDMDSVVGACGYVRDMQGPPLTR